jgi:peptidoglycan/xylan/chitin deacetylase (PgdA/CDA1 family)
LTERSHAVPAGTHPGAFVISLDFELHWGMRDVEKGHGVVAADLVRSRSHVRQLADLFAERSIRATWATVGLLFAGSRQELLSFLPTTRPHYARTELDPYAEILGEDEDDDPLHFAGSLVRYLAASPGQEIASHTFSHFYCLEAGQDEQALRADLDAARAIAAPLGVPLRSLVLPRNQWNPRYARAVRECGFTCYRGPQPSWGNRAQRSETTTQTRRAARLVDTYAGLSPPPTSGWEELVDDAGLCNIPASVFLRPYSARRRALEPLRRARITSGLRTAARRGRLFHLWWHPHNFARHPEENFDLLRAVLDEAARLADSDGLMSMSMGDVSSVALAEVPPSPRTT